MYWFVFLTRAQHFVDDFSFSLVLFDFRECALANKNPFNFIRFSVNAKYDRILLLKPKFFQNEKKMIQIAVLWFRYHIHIRQQFTLFQFSVEIPFSPSNNILIRSVSISWFSILLILSFNFFFVYRYNLNIQKH